MHSSKHHRNFKKELEKKRKDYYRRKQDPEYILKRKQYYQTHKDKIKEKR